MSNPGRQGARAGCALRTAPPQVRLGSGICDLKHGERLAGSASVQTFGGSHGGKQGCGDARVGETSGRSGARPRALAGVFEELLAPFRPDLGVVRAIGMGTRRRPAALRLEKPLEASVESVLSGVSTQSTKGSSILVRLM
jgi:hypothetical protein